MREMNEMKQGKNRPNVNEQKKIKIEKKNHPTN